MGKKELATLIDAYADAKTSGNKYLAQVMIAQLEQALNQVFGSDIEGGGESVVGSDDPNADGEY